jgi:autotransporter-associated beta strand protein
MPRCKILCAIPRRICLWLLVTAGLLICGLESSPATVVVNFAPGAEASPTGLTASQITVMQTAPFNTLVLFSITVETNGDFYYGGGGGPAIQLCTGGVYVGPANWGALLSQCEAPPSTINRIEMCIGGWLDQSFLNIKNLIAANGAGSGTVLYKNLGALKSALGLTAMDYDEEYEYDSSSAIAFGQMCAAVGLKVTFCPYTNVGYWQAVKTGLGSTVDYVYLQCYAGGQGNDAGAWSSYFGGSVPVLPGDWDADAGGDIGFLNLMQTGAQEGCIGGWFWPNEGNGVTPPFALKLYPDLIHAAFDKKTNYWTGGAADFNSSARWAAGMVPQFSTNAIDDNGSNNVVQFNAGDPAWNPGGLWAGDGTNANGAYVQGGAVVTITNSGGWMRLGDCPGATGYYTLNAGTLNLSSNLTVIGESGTGVLTLSGGTPLLGNVVLGVNSGGTGSLNLNGILMNVQGMAGGSGSSTVNFNGGTIQAAGNTSSFMSGVTTASMSANGVSFDSQGFSVAVSQALGGVGGLAKIGSGTLTLSGYNSFTGPTMVNAGTLAAAGNNDVNSTLSYTASLTVNAGGTVKVLGNNSLFGYGMHVVPVTVNAGGMLTISNGLTAHIKGPVSLNGGTLASADTGNGANGSWNLDSGAVGTLGGPVTSTISAQNVLMASPCLFTVPAGATNGIDLNVPGYFASGTLLKAGAGTMVLTGTNTYTGGTGITAGTLQLGDGLIANGVVATAITNQGTLIFANPWLQNYNSAITGSGGLVKTGAGRLVLSQFNTYTGPTTIAAGTLALTNSALISSTSSFTISNGAVVDVVGKSGQTLSISSSGYLRGGGCILGKLSAAVGSTVNPGDGIGSLTVSNGITVGGTLLMELNRTNSPVCDQLISTAGTIAVTGTLTVTNLGPALQAGDVFQLFPGPVGGIPKINLPVLPVTCAWTNRLAMDGSIQVVPSSFTVITNLSAQVSNHILTLSWPADHTGWKLQSQTNFPAQGLGTNWSDVANSTNVNQVAIPMDPSTAACSSV